MRSSDASDRVTPPSRWPVLAPRPLWPVALCSVCEGERLDRVPRPVRRDVDVALRSEPICSALAWPLALRTVES